jgi:hypothetical protein
MAQKAQDKADRKAARKIQDNAVRKAAAVV